MASQNVVKDYLIIPEMSHQGSEVIVRVRKRPVEHLREGRVVLIDLQLGLLVLRLNPTPRAALDATHPVIEEPFGPTPIAPRRRARRYSGDILLSLAGRAICQTSLQKSNQSKLTVPQGPLWSGELPSMTIVLGVCELGE